MKITRLDDGGFDAQCEPGDVRFDALMHCALVCFPAAVGFGEALDKFSDAEQAEICEAVGRALLNAIRDAPDDARRDGVPVSDGAQDLDRRVIAGVQTQRGLPFP